MRRSGQAVIDADNSIVKRFGDAKRPAQVARPDIGGEAKRRVVRGADDRGFVAEPHDRRDRTEGFFFKDAHPALDANQHGGIEEQPLTPVAADQRGGAFRDGIVYMRGDLAHYTYWYDHPPGGWLQLAAFLAPLHLLGVDSSVGVGRYVMVIYTMVTSGLIFKLCRNLDLRFPAAVVSMLIWGCARW